MPNPNGGGRMGRIAKSLLSGTALLAVVAPPARAADLPVKQAVPIEYVRVCTAYGAGFFYIPGTDTCLRVSGRARFEAGYIPVQNRNNSGGDLSQYRGLMRMNFDARTQTGYGSLRAFLRVEAASRTGVFMASGTQQRIGNAFPAVGQDQLGRVQNFIVTDKAFVQFAGLTAGRASSFFDFYAHDYELIGSTAGSDVPSTNLLAFTKTFGEGWSATLSMEDPNFRKNPFYAASFSAPATGPGQSGVNNVFNTAPSPVILGTNADGTANTVVFVDTVQRSRMPDFVGALRYDAPWGSAQLSAAVKDVNIGGFIANSAVSTLTPVAGAAGPVGPGTAAALLAARNLRSGAQTEYGWAVQGGLKLNMPWIAPGDGLYLQGAYGEGALIYTGFSIFTGTYASQLTPVQGAPFAHVLADAVVNPLTGRIDLSKSFTATASFLHYWTPEWRSAFFGSYGEVSFPRGTREAFSLVNNLVGTSAPPTGAGFAVSPILRDNYQIIAGTSLIWSPVKDLDIGIEGTYIGTGPLSGRITDSTRPVTVNGLPAFTEKRYDTTQIRMRVQRDF
ncbi:hypothetical protein BGCPKDLD_2288 [Methylorubrum suomiense]|uniref:Porin n=2 Tax=Methylorubrum suomiense TaxID=144191 RepID=A0ABQ4UTX2_9HYPH|nr:hypothetical protein BGCPKDLD_2288 [Methylorubrum suomiense]